MEEAAERMELKGILQVLILSFGTEWGMAMKLEVVLQFMTCPLIVTMPLFITVHPILVTNYENILHNKFFGGIRFRL